MSQEDKKLFTDRRWTDPPKATVIGRADISDKELKQKREMFLDRLRKNGALKDELNNGLKALTQQRGCFFQE